jgi:hypothetical protein
MGLARKLSSFEDAQEELDMERIENGRSGLDEPCLLCSAILCHCSTEAWFDCKLVHSRD